MLELVVLAAADIDPSLRLQPGNDLAGIGLDRRHTNPLYAQYIAQFHASVKPVKKINQRHLYAPHPRARQSRP